MVVTCGLRGDRQLLGFKRGGIVCY
jgi:hypothetical protein